MFRKRAHSALGSVFPRTWLRATLVVASLSAIAAHARWCMRVCARRKSVHAAMRLTFFRHARAMGERAVQCAAASRSRIALEQQSESTSARHQADRCLRKAATRSINAGRREDTMSRLQSVAAALLR